MRDRFTSWLAGAAVLLMVSAATAGTYSQIVINGDFSDWADVPLLAIDPAEGGGVDYASVKVANDDDYIYVYLSLHTAADPWTVTSKVGLDGDGNHGTGFAVFGGLIGSELMIEGATAYQQAGGGFNEGTLAAGTVSQSPFAVSATEFEFRIDRNVVGVTAPFDGISLITGDAIEFLLWDDVSGDQFQFSYIFASAPLCPGPLTTYRTMSIDGDFADWGFVPAVAVDPVDAGSGVDYAVVRAANDDDYLYFYIKLHSLGDPFSFDSNYYFDGDNNIATGFPTFSVGSEMLGQGAAAYQQAGGGFNEGTLAAGTTLHSPFGLASTEFEMRVDRNVVGVAGAFTGAPLITASTIGVVFQGDTDGTVDVVEFSYTFATSVCPGAVAPGGVDGEGRPLGDLNGDCVVDINDFATMQLNLTGP